METKNIAVIGGGFSGLAAASYLAQAGFKVTLFEKNSSVGGRNRKFSEQGFTFEMGPSWYWMPEVFDGYFSDFNRNREDFYSLTKLNPSFSIVFKDKVKLDIPSEEKELIELFESIEKGAGKKLIEFMDDAKYKYDTSMDKLIYKPGKTLLEFIEPEVIRGIFKLNLFSNFKKFVRKYFKDHKLTALMDFPVLFLGSAPENTPALYSLMNYAGLMLGTWYPKNGMYQIIQSMEALALDLGVEIVTNADVDSIIVDDNRATELVVNDSVYKFDALVAAGDYKHMETLLPKEFRNYNDKYWNSRTLAPSSLIFFLGVNKEIPCLDHHTLFFDESLDDHSSEIYTNPAWPEKPLFYVCNPSKTDKQIAPVGHENLFVLIPIAPGLEDSEEIREHYFKIILERLEKQIDDKIGENIVCKKSYCINDFVSDYHSFKGNAYGLANTLNQTAILKPKLNNKKLKNMVYAGQLTVPGPGMPPALISGKLAADELIAYFKQ